MRLIEKILTYLDNAENVNLKQHPDDLLDISYPTFSEIYSQNRARFLKIPKIKTKFDSIVSDWKYVKILADNENHNNQLIIRQLG